MNNIEVLMHANIPEIVISRIVKEMMDEKSGYEIEVLAWDKKEWRSGSNFDNELYLREFNPEYSRAYDSKDNNKMGFMYVVRWTEWGEQGRFRNGDIDLQVIHSRCLNMLVDLM